MCGAPYHDRRQQPERLCTLRGTGARRLSDHRLRHGLYQGHTPLHLGHALSAALAKAVTERVTLRVSMQGPNSANTGMRTMAMQCVKAMTPQSLLKDQGDRV